MYLSEKLTFKGKSGQTSRLVCQLKSTTTFFLDIVEMTRNFTIPIHAFFLFILLTCKLSVMLIPSTLSPTTSLSLLVEQKKHIGLPGACHFNLVAGIEFHDLALKTSPSHYN